MVENLNVKSTFVQFVANSSDEAAILHGIITEYHQVRIFFLFFCIFFVHFEDFINHVVFLLFRSHYAIVVQ